MTYNIWDTAKKSQRTFLLSFVAAVLCGIALGAWITHLVRIDPLKGFWDIATSVGTWAAVAVALFVSVSSKLEASRIEKARANLVAAQVLGSLNTMLSRAKAMQAPLAFYDDVKDGAGTDPFNGYPFVDEYPLEIPTDTLVALLPLQDGVAHRIAFGLSTLALLRNEMKAILDGGPWWSIDKGNRLFFAQEWRQALGQGITLVEAARNECQKIAKLATPPPPLDHDAFDDL